MWHRRYFLCVDSDFPAGAEKYGFVRAINDFRDFKVLMTLKSGGVYRQKRSAAKHLKISRCIYGKKYV